MSGIWDVKHDDRRKTVTVTMGWDAAEFIGVELPHGDGFTRDWYELVWKHIPDPEEQP